MDVVGVDVVVDDWVEVVELDWKSGLGSELGCS